MAGTVASAVKSSLSSMGAAFPPDSNNYKTSSTLKYFQSPEEGNREHSVKLRCVIYLLLFNDVIRSSGCRKSNNKLISQYRFSHD
jgi:hypothetical protein